jgi:hypothetical protein
MKINITTHQDECVEFLSFFSLFSDHTLEVRKITPLHEGESPEYFENEFGWTSWLHLSSYSYLDQKNRKLPIEYPEKVIKTKIYLVEEFVKENNIISFASLQGNFYEISKGKYVIENYRDSAWFNAKITPDCFGVSLKFIYTNEPEMETYVIENYVANAFMQLKIFFYAFANKHSTKKLYLLPHLDIAAWEANEELQGRVYPDNYDSSDPDYDESAGWEELGRQEERNMDEESDGHWRWNID